MRVSDLRSVRQMRAFKSMPRYCRFDEVTFELKHEPRVTLHAYSSLVLPQVLEHLRAVAKGQSWSERDFFNLLLQYALFIDDPSAHPVASMGWGSKSSVAVLRFLETNVWSSEISDLRQNKGELLCEKFVTWLIEIGRYQRWYARG